MIYSGVNIPDTWQKLAQEILGVDPSMIRLIGNTMDAPDAGPGTLSRNICSLTRLMVKCFTAIRNQRFRDPLPITVKRIDRSGKAQISEKNPNPEAFAYPGWAAGVVEIEIDPVSFHPVTKGVWLVVDGGKILNERRARLTLKTGVIQALGWASREQLRYQEGKIPGKYYRDYDITAPGEIPPITVDFIWSNTAIHKGIGDLPFCCVPAAYVQAVSQAMDHHFEKIPLGVKDIWDIWMKKQTEMPK
jgi:CO/xanthine dehydrogenase Mo-binding subunit